MGGQRQTYQRKILFIKKEFQARIIAIILLCVFVFSNISLSLTIVFVSSFFADASINELLVSESFYSLVLPSLLIIQLMGLAVILYLGLFVSHRMAGPIYRLEKCAEQIETGDLSLNVRIRPHDEFQELAAAMDRMVGSVRAKVAGIRDMCANLKRSSARMSVRIDNDASESLKKEFADLVFMIESIDDLVSEFKLEKSPPPVPSDPSGGSAK